MYMVVCQVIFQQVFNFGIYFSFDVKWFFKFCFSQCYYVFCVVMLFSEDFVQCEYFLYIQCLNFSIKVDWFGVVDLYIYVIGRVFIMELVLFYVFGFCKSFGRSSIIVCIQAEIDIFVCQFS